MKRHGLRRLLAGVLAAGLLAAPALAAEAPAPQLPDPWAVEDPVTAEQAETLTAVVADKLALLELPQRAADTAGLVVDVTRGGVMNALYQEAAAYEIDGVAEGPAAFLPAWGWSRGTRPGR